MKGLSARLFVFVLLIFARPSYAVVSVATGDCPAARSHYSVDMPLSDVVRNKELLEKIAAISPQAANKFAKPFGDFPLDERFGNIISPAFLFQQHIIHVDEKTKSEITRLLESTLMTDAAKEENCARYDNIRPDIPAAENSKRILVFGKVNGFVHGEAIAASVPAFKELAASNSMDIFFTDKAGVFNADDLSQFNVIVWNNISGDALTFSQRDALKAFIVNGGGFVAVHGAGGDLQYFWDWYADELISARFTGHPMSPQFQSARLITESKNPVLTKDLPASFEMSEEWYSFEQSPRSKDVEVIVTIDESSYEPLGFGGQSLAMGDHPIVWAKCAGQGRVFYTAIGHKAESFSDAYAVRLLENGLIWASSGNEGGQCADDLATNNAGGEK
ncbi:ThuA domain-containing protein [Alteromonas sp. NFXS44]|uniref:ThuA domain-containing protein n=1 Tax=Alteromonas sp. NFXS44 TaxID=2818435 RepID=UPI0032DE848A